MTKRAVTENAVLKRINRKLAHEHERLTYGVNPWCSTVKCYRVLDTSNNTITGTVDELEAYARDLGVLAANERIAA